MCVLPKPATCGTVGYLASELENIVYLSQQTRVYDCAVDVFALGVVGQELFSSAIRPTALQVWSESTGLPKNPFRKPIELTRVAALTELCHDLSSNVETKSESKQLVACMLTISHKKKFNAKEALSNVALEAAMADIIRRTEESFSRKRKNKQYQFICFYSTSAWHTHGGHSDLAR